MVFFFFFRKSQTARTAFGLLIPVKYLPSWIFRARRSREILNSNICKRIIRLKRHARFYTTMSTAFISMQYWLYGPEAWQYFFRLTKISGNSQVYCVGIRVVNHSGKAHLSSVFRVFETILLYMKSIRKNIENQYTHVNDKRWETGCRSAVQ